MAEAQYVESPFVVASFTKEGILKAQQAIKSSDWSSIRNHSVADAFIFSDKDIVRFEHQQNFKRGGGGGQNWSVDFELVDPEYEFEFKLRVFSDPNFLIQHHISLRSAMSHINLEEIQQNLVDAFTSYELEDDPDRKYTRFPTQQSGTETLSAWMSDLFEALLNRSKIDDSMTFDPTTTEGQAIEAGAVGYYPNPSPTAQDWVAGVRKEGGNPTIPSLNDTFGSEMSDQFTGWFYQDMKDVIFNLASEVFEGRQSATHWTGPFSGYAGDLGNYTSQFVEVEEDLKGSKTFDYKLKTNEMITHVITNLIKELMTIQRHLRSGNDNSLQLYFMYGNSLNPATWSDTMGCTIKSIDFVQAGTGARVLKIGAIPSFSKLSLGDTYQTIDYGSRVLSRGFSDIPITALMNLGEYIPLQTARWYDQGKQAADKKAAYSPNFFTNTVNFNRVFTDIVSTLLGGPLAAKGVQADLATLPLFNNVNARVYKQLNLIRKSFPTYMKISTDVEEDGQNNLDLEEDEMSAWLKWQKSHRLGEAIFLAYHSYEVPPQKDPNLTPQQNEELRAQKQTEEDIGKEKFKEAYEKAGLTSSEVVISLGKGVFIATEIAEFLGLSVRWPMRSGGSDPAPHQVVRNIPSNLGLLFAEHAGYLDYTQGIQFELVTKSDQTQQEALNAWFKHLQANLKVGLFSWFVETTPEIINEWHGAGLFGTPHPSKVLVLGHIPIIRKLLYGDMYKEKLLLQGGTDKNISSDKIVTLDPGRPGGLNIAPLKGIPPTPIPNIGKTLQMWEWVSDFDAGYFSTKISFIENMFFLMQKRLWDDGAGIGSHQLFMSPGFRNKDFSTLDAFELIKLGVPVFTSNDKDSNILAVNFRSQPQYFHAMMNSYNIDNSNLTLFSYLNSDVPTGAYLKTFINTNGNIPIAEMQAILNTANLYEMVMDDRYYGEWGAWKDKLTDQFTTDAERKVYFGGLQQKLLAMLAMAEADQQIVQSAGVTSNDVMSVLLNILDKVHTYSLTGSIRTLPNFRISGNKSILGGTPAIIDITEPIINTTNFSQNKGILSEGLGKHLSGLWRLFGYKHTIKSGTCSSEFGLVRDLATSLVNKPLE